MTYSFEVNSNDLAINITEYVDVLMGSLQSSFMVMPRGDAFVDYPVFEDGYEALRKATSGFELLNKVQIMDAVLRKPMALIVLRAILGFSPPEWAYVTTDRTGIDVSLNYSRALDRKIRGNPNGPLRVTDLTRTRIEALIDVACQLLEEGVPNTTPKSALHRLDKADTASGTNSLIQVASMHIPYPMLLYERLLGRPFATQRDSVSEKVADLMEGPIEDVLTEARIPYRKTKRAEHVNGFDQAPDFIVPDEFNPQIVIEAKITEDDGTARDKITRVQRLALMNVERERDGMLPFQVVACIDGRGFVRRSDIEKLILCTGGKVFTLNTLDRMVECTRLVEYSARRDIYPYPTPDR